MKFWFTKTASNESETEEFDIIDQCVDKGEKAVEDNGASEDNGAGECSETVNNSDGFRPRINAYTNYLHTLMIDTFPEYKDKYGSCYQQLKIKTIDLATVTKREAIEVWNGLKQQNIEELLQTKPKTQCGYYNETGL